MNVKIAMLVAASEYERLTLDAARSSSMPAPKCTEAQAMDCRERAVSPSSDEYTEAEPGGSASQVLAIWCV